MEWKPLRYALEKSSLPQGYVFEELKKEEIPLIARLLGAWYPDIQVGSESRHLKPDFYETSVYFAEDGTDKPLLALTFKHNDKIVGFMNLHKDIDARNISVVMGCIAPDHRGQGLAHMGPLIVEAMGRAIGAELIYYFVTLKIPHQQAAAEKMGFKLVGIVPAYDRDLVAPGVIKRVFEAIYAKVLIDDAQLLRPAAEALTPATQRLWDFLFGAAS